ncbi:PREDICTED: PRUPE_5G227300 [Prunus dulcis]|uniref:PREDICTED: PRUPE_5G227300 n=1 Tax=Prunus dulcis TaxID=3755 RepID=A0A5E4G048_PRUDU|nr:PREDICTED: PRUPE_5G227300 [Prunus dulcis]
MVRSFVSASTMKITTVHNVAISRGLGSVSDYGDQELVNLEVINHLVTTVKPEAFFFCVAWFLGAGKMKAKDESQMGKRVGPHGRHGFFQVFFNLFK